MRTPKPADTPAEEAPPPAGGRALGRARQFALSRGLPEPVVEKNDAVARAARKSRQPAPGPAPAPKPRKPIDR